MTDPRNVVDLTIERQKRQINRTPNYAPHPGIPEWGRLAPGESVDDWYNSFFPKED